MDKFLFVDLLMFGVAVDYSVWRGYLPMFNLLLQVPLDEDAVKNKKAKCNSAFCRYFQWHLMGSEFTMKQSKHAIHSLLWMAGVAGAQPSALILDSVVLPASVTEAAQAASVPLGAVVRTHFVVLPALEEDQALSSGDASGSALQIGTARAVADTSTVAHTRSALKWTALPTGQQVAAINIQSAGAYGLRAGVLVESLPDGVQLRIYSQERSDAIVEYSGDKINALLTQNAEAGETGAAANTWWTPDVGAGDATVEVLLPAGISTDALRISVPMVSHIYQNLSLPTDAEWAQVEQEDAAQAGPAASCNLDVTCSDKYQTERNAVARMFYTRPDGASYTCTGTLLNNSNGDFVPYFLTANHCISDQATASTLQTRWFYRSSSCNSGVPSADSARRNGGATLLLATAKTDSTLLRLNDMPPAGVTLAGWNASDIVPFDAEVYGLHHPRGDLLKYNLGLLADYTDCRRETATSFRCDFGRPSGGFYSVSMSEGTTEGGSSGSALFREGRVVGTLYGGSHSCTALWGNTTYGRFDKFFTEGASRWLAPPTGPMRR